MLNPNDVISHSWIYRHACRCLFLHCWCCPSIGMCSTNNTSCLASTSSTVVGIHSWASSVHAAFLMYCDWWLLSSWERGNNGSTKFAEHICVFTREKGLSSRQKVLLGLPPSQEQKALSTPRPAEPFKTTPGSLGPPLVGHHIQEEHHFACYQYLQALLSKPWSPNSAPHTLVRWPWP